MTLREKVARLMARQYWRGRGEEITQEMEDEFWMASLKDADAILALLSTADSEQRETVEARNEERHQRYLANPMSLTASSYYIHGLQEEVADLWRKLEEEKESRTAEWKAAKMLVDDLRRKLDEARVDLDREKAESDDAVEELRGRLAEERCKLEETKERVDNWLDEAKEAESRYTSASLASAALRTALELATELYENGLVDFKKYGLTCDEDIAKKYNAALALPTDGLAEEVVWLLTRSFPDRCDGDLQDEWYNRCSALLSRIGAPT